MQQRIAGVQHDLNTSRKRRRRDTDIRSAAAARRLRRRTALLHCNILAMPMDVCRFDDDEKFLVRVVVGAHELAAKEKSQTHHRVKRIVIHENYIFWWRAIYDVMLLQLETKIEYNEYASPICFDTTKFAPDTECVSTGWGLTSYAGSATVLPSIIHAPFHQVSEHFRKERNTLTVRLPCPVQLPPTRPSRSRTQPHIWSLGVVDMTTSRRCCVNCTGFLFLDELTTRLHVWCTSR